MCTRFMNYKAFAEINSIFLVLYCITFVVLFQIIVMLGTGLGLGDLQSKQV